jgi:glycosyltransferase involved in cell wall biosynthesis
MPKLIHVATVALTSRAFLLPFARHFIARGWTVDLMAREAATCQVCNSAFSHTFEAGWSRNPADLTGLGKAITQVRRTIQQGRYDIVHVHTPIAGFLSRFALRSLRRQGKPKVIYTAHGFHFHPGGRFLANLLFLSMEKLAGRWTDYLVVINRVDRDAVLRHGIVPPGRLRLIPGIGVDTRYYSPTPLSSEEVHNTRTRLNLDATTPLFLMIAEFNPGKRHCDAIEALARMETRTAHLAFAGVGPLQKAMQQKARHLGIADRVHFLGFQSDVRPWIAACTATVLPSIREGLPRCSLESMSMGIPVIGTRSRGLEELLEDDCGLLVPVRDPAALAAAMDRIVRAPELARGLVTRARERILSRYSLDHILACHETLYDEALRGPA